MTQRGRKSAAELAVANQSDDLELKKPEPPSSLTAEQAEVWRDTVSPLPFEWFTRETFALLEAYCGHVSEIRFLARMIDQMRTEGPWDVEKYEDLLKMRERETRAASSLATRMRITQQSTYDREKSKNKKTAKKPW